MKINFKLTKTFSLFSLSMCLCCLLAFESVKAQTNLALTGTATATQSSNGAGGGYPASLGNDGILDNFQHTKAQKECEYWELDLGQIENFEANVIYNRSTAKERLGKAWLLISDTPFPTTGAEPADLAAAKSQATFEYQFPDDTSNLDVAVLNILDFTNNSAHTNLKGKHIRIQKPGGVDSGDKVLNLAEIEVYDFAPDLTAPTVATLTPDNNDTDYAVLDANLQITFDETVQAGTGNITLFDASDDSVVEAIDVTGPQVTISGATINFLK